MNTGQNVTMSHTYSSQDPTSYSRIQLRCAEVNKTQITGSAWCKTDSGELNSIDPPQCVVEVEEVHYDEIDLSKAVPILDPEVPPRVPELPGLLISTAPGLPGVQEHELPTSEGKVPGYLGVMEPYHYDVVGEEKPLQHWISPRYDAHGDGSKVDEDGYQMPKETRNEAESSL
ncbi:hypothetical protein B566_EDAN013585 [Ephemera danica]|nr:hypothetical protein B566_EDAN013585 [Ephemera danica]